MLDLIPTKKTYWRLREVMPRHYSAPRNSLGRSICYGVFCNNRYYGHIVAGSAVLHLPNRPVLPLNNIVNNIFYHVEPNGGYPLRNFTSKVIACFREQVIEDWKSVYGDEVLAFETLVELPRTGECYKRDGWKEIGLTKGHTCKRPGGKGTDSWSGKRVWDTTNLRPKRVFFRYVEN